MVGIDRRLRTEQNLTGKNGRCHETPMARWGELGEVDGQAARKHLDSVRSSNKNPNLKRKQGNILRGSTC